jgi:hypothetical protein
MLTHEAYLDTLRSTRSTTAEWRAVLAGFLVLRLIDAWLDDDGHLVPRDSAGLHAVQEALAGMRDKDRERPILCELVDMVIQSEHSGVQSIASQMFNYGQILHFTNQWGLALDVFASLLSHALAVQDQLTSIWAAIRLGLVLNQLGQMDSSQDAYTLASQWALSTNRLDLYCIAYRGIALNYMYLGHCNEAERIIDTTIVEAEAHGLTDILAAGLHTKSALEVSRGHYGAAIQLGETALTYMDRPEVKDRLLVNLGGAFVGSGDHIIAKKILSSVVQRTEEDQTRQRALINLLEIAAKDRDRVAFDRRRCELHGTLVLPDLQAHYHLYLGKGHHIFENPIAARDAWQDAYTIAMAHGLAQTCTKIQIEMVAAGEVPPKLISQ